MGLYSRAIFPRLCDWVMSDPRLAIYRKQVLASVDGVILEIGLGTGLNLPHYPPHIRTIVAVDPNAGMSKLARKRIEESGLIVEQSLAGGEVLPFGDASFDSVVSTWTLCSIAEIGRALGEVYRVLKPGGRFVFLEHGLSDDPKVQKWQRRLNSIQRRLAGGCRLDLDVRRVLEEQPFRSIDLDKFLMGKTPRTHGSMYRGTATK